MNTDALFKEREPPPGGAERFAQRLDEAAAEHASPRRRTVALVAAAASVAIVTTLVLLRPAGDAVEPTVVDTPPAVDVYGAPEFDRLLGRTSAPAELTVIVNTEAARVTQLETTTAKVRIYQIN